ncbi:trehalose-phosphatase [Patescibacteria group bacterium]|nr:trehalose-phosphatase [Patescibacteria group bacterium]
MKYLWQNLDKITPLLKKDCPKVLLLDFDGTLVPIAKSPQKANLSQENRSLLQKLSQKPNFYLAIISGRKLSDIKEKIRLPNIIYSGNHGLKWEIFNKIDSYPIPNKTLSIVKAIRKQLDGIADKSRGVFIEDKGPVLSFHYRLVDKQQISVIKSQFKRVIKPYVENGLISILTGKMVFDIYPKVNWDKGYFAKFVINKIRTRTKTAPVVIFIGDDTTDESIFKTLKNKITIAVGKKRQSKAKYYVNNTNEVVQILKILL